MVINSDGHLDIRAPILVFLHEPREYREEAGHGAIIEEAIIPIEED